MDTSKLDDTVNQILQDAVAKAAQGAEFLKGEVPAVVQQLLHWNMLACLAWSACALIAIGIVVWANVIAFRTKDDDYFAPAALGGSAIAIFALIVLTNNIIEAIKISIAPKVWLLEYAAHLVRR